MILTDLGDGLDIVSTWIPAVLCPERSLPRLDLCSYLSELVREGHLELVRLLGISRTSVISVVGCSR